MNMKNQYKGMRTHFCGELRKEDSGSEVTLMGWVRRRRDHGGLIFVDLRDRYGLTQVVFNPQMPNELFKSAEKLSVEDVLKITGKVGERPEGTVNPDLDTGAIEVTAESLEILSEAETPPFEIKEEVEASEDLRLEYRYLDLRRRNMRDAIITRHEFYQSVRKFMSDKGFIEIETPVLTKSTPEGARDFLVPSRISKGKFYALPQSPQIYKQILMVSGFDKYFQIVKAFRDEDLRADRQPEHTQIDIEMSFVEERHVQEMTEELMATVFKEVIDVELPLPFPRLTYDEAMTRFGSDKPDMRFGVELTDISERAADSNFQIFKDAVANGGTLSCISAPAKGSFSRKIIDELIEFVKIYGLKGLSWAKVENVRQARKGPSEDRNSLYPPVPLPAPRSGAGEIAGPSSAQRSRTGNARGADRVSGRNPTGRIRGHPRPRRHASGRRSRAHRSPIRARSSAAARRCSRDRQRDECRAIQPSPRDPDRSVPARESPLRLRHLPLGTARPRTFQGAAQQPGRPAPFRKRAPRGSRDGRRTASAGHPDSESSRDSDRVAEQRADLRARGGSWVVPFQPGVARFATQLPSGRYAIFGVSTTRRDGLSIARSRKPEPRSVPKLDRPKTPAIPEY